MATIQGTSGDDVRNGTGERDLMYGGAGDDTLNGGGGNDVLYGGEGDDTLDGGEGDDQLSGGEGADRMTGGAGNDTYYVDDIGDQVIELNNGGIDTVVSTLAGYTLRDNVERLTLGGAGDINGNGNALDNRLSGNSGNNHLHGRAGNDSIYGYGGDDVIAGGSGNDVMNGGDGNDTITFRVDETAGQGVTVDLAINTRSQNTGQGIDTIAGFENVEGTSSDDEISGDAGANKINGGRGDDLIRGRGGDDDLTAGEGGDTIRFESTANNGVDVVRGFSSGSDSLAFLTSDGYAANARLTLGTQASGTGAQFVFDGARDLLYYDADGEGGSDAVLLAYLPEADLTGFDLTVNGAPVSDFVPL